MAVPPELTNSKPPLLTVVLIIVPERRAASRPPLLIVTACAAAGVHDEAARGRNADAVDDSVERGAAGEYAKDSKAREDRAGRGAAGPAGGGQELGRAGCAAA